MEKSSGMKPCKTADALATNDDRQIIGLILEKSKKFPRIIAIIQSPKENLNSFSFHEVEGSRVRNR